MTSDHRDLMSLSKRVGTLSQRLYGVMTEARGRDLIPPQRDTVRDAASELLGLSDEIRAAAASVNESDARHTSTVLDRMAEALTNDDLEEAQNSADFLSRELERLSLVLRAAPARAVLGPALERSYESSWGTMNDFDFVGSFTRAVMGQPTVLELPVNLPEYRALTTSGGSAVATTFANFVLVSQSQANPILNPALTRTISTPDGHPIVVPQVTARAATGGTVTTEGGAISTAEPTVASFTLQAFKYAELGQWSSELDQDNVIRIESLVAHDLGTALGLGMGTALTSGTGTLEPNGFMNRASAGATATLAAGGTASHFFDWSDLASLYAAVVPPYRDSGIWMFSNTAYGTALKMVDNQGRPILDISAAGPPTLFGRPVYVNGAMAAVSSASKSVAFGDLASQFVVRRAPQRVEISRDWAFGSDLVTIRVAERIDSYLSDTAAVKYLVSADT